MELHFLLNKFFKSPDSLHFNSIMNQSNLDSEIITKKRFSRTNVKSKPAHQSMKTHTHMEPTNKLSLTVLYAEKRERLHRIPLWPSIGALLILFHPYPRDSRGQKEIAETEGGENPRSSFERYKLALSHNEKPVQHTSGHNPATKRTVCWSQYDKNISQTVTLIHRKDIL